LFLLWPFLSIESVCSIVLSALWSPFATTFQSRPCPRRFLRFEQWHVVHFPAPATISDVDICRVLEGRSLVVSVPSFPIAHCLPPSSSFAAIQSHPIISVVSIWLDFVVIELFLETYRVAMYSVLLLR
jgi:hypothetical protein